MCAVGVAHCRFLTLALVVSGLAGEPSTFETRKAHVRTLLQVQNFAAAANEARAINREWPDDVITYQLLAEAHLGLGNYTDAEKAIQWMLDLRIGKTDSAGWSLVARFREVIGDIDGAIEALGQALTRDSQGEQRQRLLVYLAQLHVIKGRLDLAEQALGEPLSLARPDPDVIATLARIRIAQGKRDQAVQLLRDSASREVHPRYLYLLAAVTRDRADYARFERAALQTTTSRNNANRELALYYAGPGHRAAEALRIARLESESRHDVFTMDALAMALYASGKPAEAREIMKRVLDVGTRDSGIREHARRIGLR